jgi:hypothetical protein
VLEAPPVSTADARDAEIERLRGRLAALEAAAQASIKPCPGGRKCRCRENGIAHNVVYGGTQALDARIATEREAVLADVKARVGALQRYVDTDAACAHPDGPLVSRYEVLSAIDAAGSGR